MKPGKTEKDALSSDEEKTDSDDEWVHKFKVANPHPLVKRRAPTIQISSGSHHTLVPVNDERMPSSINSNSETVFGPEILRLALLDLKEATAEGMIEWMKVNVPKVVTIFSSLTKLRYSMVGLLSCSSYASWFEQRGFEKGKTLWTLNNKKANIPFPDSRQKDLSKPKLDEYIIDANGNPKKRETRGRPRKNKDTSSSPHISTNRHSNLPIPSSNPKPFSFKSPVCASCLKKYSQTSESLVRCEVCLQTYHLFCCSPPLSELPKTAYTCSSCLKGKISRRSVMKNPSTSVETPLAGHPSPHQRQSVSNSACHIHHSERKFCPPNCWLKDIGTSFSLYG